MIIIVKERGDISEKIGVLQIDDEYEEITIIKHPDYEEGNKYNISMLSGLIESMKRTK